MRKIQFYLMLLLAMALFVPQAVIAQEDETEEEAFDGFDVTNPMDQTSNLGALLGYANMGGQDVIGMRIQPDLSFGKLGFGLDVPIMYDITNGGLRTEEFTDGVGILRMARYVRYGVKKKDPIYVRVGDLGDTYIGFGMLVDNYTNSISFEKRKMGINFDVLIGNMVGIEGLYSDLDFASLNLLAVRPYIKPLGRLPLPFVRSTEIGFTYVTDKDQTFLETEDEDGTINHYQTNYLLKDGMSAWAIDIGITPISMKMMQLKIYAQYGNLMKNDLLKDAATLLATDPTLTAEQAALLNGYDGANGMGVGVDFKFKFLGNVLRLDTKIERLFYNKYFMPQFFDAGYEMNKDAKLLTLASTDGKSGIYGSLALTALNKIRVGGSLMIPDNVSETAPAMLTLDLDASQLMEKAILKAHYIKAGIGDMSDALSLDDRSLLNIRAAYKFYKFLVLGLDFRYTWIINDKEIEGTDQTEQVYEADRVIMPYFGLDLPLNFGGGKKSTIGIDDEE